MSSRDMPAYDANLLAQAPEPTKEQKQSGYQTKGLLDEPRPRTTTPSRSPAPPATPAPGGSNGRTADTAEKGSYDEAERPGAAAVATPARRPWYRTPKWLIIIGLVIAAIIIAAVVGGVVGSKNSSNNNNSGAAADSSKPSGAASQTSSSSGDPNAFSNAAPTLSGAPATPTSTPTAAQSLGGAGGGAAPPGSTSDTDTGVAQSINTAVGTLTRRAVPT